MEGEVSVLVWQVLQKVKNCCAALATDSYIFSPTAADAFALVEFEANQVAVWSVEAPDLKTESYRFVSYGLF